MELAKQTLRRQLLKQRTALSKLHGGESSARVCQHILESEAYKRAQCILGYLAFGAELNVDEVLRRALKDGKKVCVPYIVSQTVFEAAEIHDLEHFVLDRYGIRTVAEPVTVLLPGQIDLILVPGVAFAKKGTRMGMGAGYYDRFLLRVPQAELLGIVYEELLQDSLPYDEYDVLIPYLVTEGGVVQTTC